MTEVVLDTSVAVPLLVTSHVAHRSVSASLGERAAALAGHALHETCAVLARLPATLASPLRLPCGTAKAAES